MVTVAVPGKPVEASDGGAVAADPQKLRRLERSGSVKWTLTLPPAAAIGSRGVRCLGHFPRRAEELLADLADPGTII